MRGEGLTSLSDGRILVAHGAGIDVLRPLFAPEIIAQSVAEGAVLTRPVTSISLQFNDDMALEGLGSVLDPASYALVNDETDILPITTLEWDASLRTITLRFDALPVGAYSLTLSDRLSSARGVPLGEPITIAFSRFEDITASVAFSFLDTRYDRETGIATYDVIVTNTGDTPLTAPLRLSLDPNDPTGNGTPLTAVGEGDIWLIDLTEALGEDGILAPGESTPARAVALLLDPAKRADFRHGVRVLPGSNLAPLVAEDAPTDAQVGVLYSHTINALDLDGSVLGYVLLDAPDGLVLDAATGALAWTPEPSARTTETVRLRVYDAQGGFAEIAWEIEVEGANTAPNVEAPTSVIELTEGEEMRLPIFASDLDGDALVLFADSLPPGAFLDHATGDLVWTPAAGQAGLYRNVLIGARDGLAETIQRFDISVRPANFAPVVAVPRPQVIREGDPLRIQLVAADLEGDALTFSSVALPARAVLHPDTGLFEWTPGYTRAGSYQVPILVSDGLSQSRIVLEITVENANGAPVLEGFDDWVVAEGQTLVFRTEAFDPDNPDFVAPERGPEGDLLFYQGSERISVSYQLEGLPEGASYDAGTGVFRWKTDFADQGRYQMILTATDDGDGTGTPAERRTQITIVVEDVNRAPVLPDMPNVEVDSGATLTVPLGAVDPDTAVLRFSATATRAAGADQIDIDPTPIALDGSDPFGRIVPDGQGGWTLEISPGDLDRGDWRIDIAVEDDGNGDTGQVLSDRGSFILTVLGDNLAPTLSPVAGLVAVPGEMLDYTFRAGDLDRDGLNFVLTGLPDSATLIPTGRYGEARLTWTPSSEDLGQFDAVVTVTDSGGRAAGTPLSDRITVPITVRTANAAPILQAVGALDIAEGETLNVSLSAADPDGDPVTYLAENLPPGSTLDPITGVLRFTPSLYQAGVYDAIVLTATDGLASASETVSLTVRQTNQAPIFVAAPDQLAREGDEISFRLLAADPDGDSVVFQPLTSLPNGARLDAASGVFTWTPGFLDAGVHRFTIAARDPLGAQATREIALTVLNTNRAPQSLVTNQSVVLGETLDVVLTANDPDSDDTVTLEIENLPTNASFDAATRRLIFTPDAGDLGDLVLRVVASDGTTQTVAAMVVRVTRDPVLPTATLNLTPSFPARQGQPVIISTAATGFVPIVDTRLYVDGVETPLDALGRATFTPDTPGSYKARLVVIDADGRVGETETRIAVRDASDVSAPQVRLDLTDGTQLMSGSITGAVSDLSLSTWRLVLTRLQTGAETVLAQGDANLSGTLATFDAGLIASGFYTLRLEASDLAGRRSSVAYDVEIPPEESRTLRHTVVDATLELGGISFDLTRVYDARQSTETGAFGPGWTAPWRDLAFDAGPAGAAGYALAEGDRLHLTAPDGTRLVFTAAFEPYSVAGFDGIRLAFSTGTPGYTLRHDGPLLTQADGRAYAVTTGLPFTPFTALGDVFHLTQPDGTEWNADGKGRITGIGNGTDRLRVADSGLFGRSGETASILTTERGAIGGITLPDGARLLYLYDDNGRLSFAGGSGSLGASNFAYEAESAGRLLAISGRDALTVGYAADGTAETGSVAAHFTSIIDADIPAALTATPEAEQAVTLTLRDSELASASGQILLMAEVSGTVDPASMMLNGRTPVGLAQSGGVTRAVFLVETAGLQRLTLSGDGVLGVSFRAAGDLDGDGAVGSTDLAMFDATAVDIDGDSDADARDRALLLANFGLMPNTAPTITLGDQKTYEDLTVEIPLLDAATDAEGDPIFFEVLGATGGVAALTPDGLAIRFTPEAGRITPATIQLAASDGYQSSAPATLTVEISDAALQAITLPERTPHLAKGERRAFAVMGAFADGGSAALDDAYVTFVIHDTAVADRINGRLVGLSDGFTALQVSRGAISAATVVTSGALAPEDEGLRVLGAEVYPESVILTPGAARPLQLFDLAGENVMTAHPDEVLSYVVNGDIVEVTADGRLIGKAPGETLVTVIYRSTEVLVPVLVTEPVVAESATFGRAGGVLQNADGYQLALADGSLNRDAEVAIRTLAFEDLGVPALPTEDGFEFGAAFELDLNGAPLAVPAQLAIPTQFEEGDLVMFYRITDFPTADGLVRGYQELDIGLVDANGIARTTSKPRPGVPSGGQHMLSKIDPSKLQMHQGIVDVQGKGPADAVVTSAFVTSSGPGAALIGAMNAGAKFVVTLPKRLTNVVTTLGHLDF